MLLLLLLESEVFMIICIGTAIHVTLLDHGTTQRSTI
jgi:hypothetical protein